MVEGFEGVWTAAARVNYGKGDLEGLAVGTDQEDGEYDGGGEGG